MPDLVLGLIETQWCWRVSCREFTLGELLELAESLVDLIHMTCDGKADYSTYPNREGKGGYGIQLYQKLVESFLVISTWPDHGFMRITIASCKSYSVEDVTAFLEEEVGGVQANGGCII